MPTLTRLSNVAEEPVRWLWPGRIPRGAITIVEGDPGTNKSTLTYDLAARVSAGLPLPESEGSDRRAEDVILVPGEDLPGTIRQDLYDADADLDRIHLASSDPADEGNVLQLPRDIDWLERQVRETETSVVVIDPNAT